MSRPVPSTDSVGITNGSDVIARRSERRGSTNPEIYGAENLPVLVRLPDLSVPIDAAQRRDIPENVDEASVVEAAAQDSATTQAGPLEPAGRGRSRRPREERRIRRLPPSATKGGRASWLPGWGQLAMAAVMAGILLAIIVTVKDRNRTAPARRGPTSEQRVEVPAIDFGQPALEPAQNMMSDQTDDFGLEPVTRDGRTLQGIAPAEMPSSNAWPSEPAAGPTSVPPSTAPTLLPRPATVAEGTGYADAGTLPAAPENYPTTGAPPVVSLPGPAGHVSNEGWRATLPVGAVRNADRSQTDPRTQQR